MISTKERPPSTTQYVVVDSEGLPCGKPMCLQDAEELRIRLMGIGLRVCLSRTAKSPRTTRK